MESELVVMMSEWYLYEAHGYKWFWSFDEKISQEFNQTNCLGKGDHML